MFRAETAILLVAESGAKFKTDTRNAYQGRLPATVQRSAPTGEIRLLATAPGLPTAANKANP